MINGSKNIRGNYIVMILVLVSAIIILAVGVAVLYNRVNLLEERINVVNLSSNRIFNPSLVSGTSNEVLKSVVIAKSRSGEGLGFAIRKDGYILTASHIVDASSNITIGFLNGTEEQAVVYNTNINNSDIAIVKINSEIKPVNLIDDVYNMRAGQRVDFIGFPEYVDSPIVNYGIISSFNSKGKYSTVRINSFVLRGDSGGPLFIPSTGEVVGVVVAKTGIIVPSVDLNSTAANYTLNERNLLDSIWQVYNVLKVAAERGNKIGLGNAVLADKNILNLLPQ